MNNMWKIRIIIRTQGNSIVLKSHLGKIVWATFMGIIKQFSRSPALNSVNTKPHSGFYPFWVTSWNWLLDYSQCYRIDYRMTVVKNAISNFCWAEAQTDSPNCFQITTWYDFNLFVNYAKRIIIINGSLVDFSKEQHKKILIEGYQ